MFLNKDIDQISKSNLNDIKDLISSYQIIQDNNSTNKNDTLINISFDKNKMNNFFYKNNISYADISKSKIIIFPIILQNEIDEIKYEILKIHKENRNPTNAKKSQKIFHS